MTDWQPIDTAPKDGTIVLLSTPDAIDPQMCIGYWTEFTAPGGGPVVEANWTACITAAEVDAEATHWMPLPAPPKEQAHG